MNLKACDECGVVLDVDVMQELPAEDDKGEWIIENMIYDGSKYLICVRCPVCKALVPNGDY